MIRTAIGFRVKSGYAIAVAVRGSTTAPAAVARRVVELCDPERAETRQPYHHGRSTHETDPDEVARRVAIVERCAHRSIEALLADEAFAHCRRAALVVGSVIDPQTVGNPHIRAHASEGQLFRTALQAALEAHGLRCVVFVEKELGARAESGLSRRTADIARTVSSFAAGLGAPWRAEEKAAATAAWLVLA